MGVAVLVGTEKGAFVCRSRDRRAWSVEGPQFKGWKATAAGRTASGRFLLGTASRVYGAAIQASDDLASWRQIESGPSYAEGGPRKLNQIWTITATPERVYAGVEEGGLFSSDDDGETWRAHDGLNEHPTRDAWFPGAGGLCAHAVLVQGARIWVGISAVGVFRSDDGGATFHPKNAGIRRVIEDEAHKDIGYCVHGLAVDPQRKDRLYRQDHTGMYRSDDGGDTWARNEDGMPSWFGFPIACDAKTGNLYAFPMESDEYRMPVGGRFAIYRSTDRGDTWQEMREGLPSHPVWAGVLRGAIDTDGEGGVYAGAVDGSVYASADHGESWQRLPCTLPRILSVDAFAE
jgi:photosystem II stability/assembly factor-like uncharacterized protein